MDGRYHVRMPCDRSSAALRIGGYVEVGLKEEGKKGGEEKCNYHAILLRRERKHQSTHSRKEALMMTNQTAQSITIIFDRSIERLHNHLAGMTESKFNL